MDRNAIITATVPYPTPLAIVPARKSAGTGAKKDPKRCLVVGMVTPSAMYGWKKFVGTGRSKRIGSPVVVDEVEDFDDLS